MAHLQNAVFTFPQQTYTEPSVNQPQMMFMSNGAPTPTPPPTPYSAFGYPSYYLITTPGVNGALARPGILYSNMTAPHNSPASPSYRGPPSLCIMPNGFTNPTYGGFPSLPPPVLQNGIQSLPTPIMPNGMQGYPIPGLQCAIQNYIQDVSSPVYAKGPSNNSFKTALCQKFVNGDICPYGSRCRYAHGQQELRLPRINHPRYKTVLCRNYASTGECDYGFRCQFKHTHESPHKVQVGRVFLNSRYGRGDVNLSGINEKDPIEPRSNYQKAKLAILDVNGNEQTDELAFALAAYQKTTDPVEDLCEGMKTMKLRKSRTFINSTYQVRETAAKKRRHSVGY